jgi:hypothetical protein
MFLGLITLLTALAISGISAYYSIIGLTAIFSAAGIPIIIMGTVLEVGKVVTTLWLHYNWDQAAWKIKSYLVAAVVILMLITSMGTFGYLSKAHLDQAVPSGDIQAKVSLFDEKIKSQRDNIDAARKALTQMDGSVDQTLSRSTDENGATKAANLRRSQAKERTRLQEDIGKAQTEITKLQEARAPVAATFRKVEAEVGPIRYIAALIYGDNPAQNLLESAVRWVIIVIVFVFDPLAIVLLLAATTSIDWARGKKEKAKVDAVGNDTTFPPTTAIDMDAQIQAAMDEVTRRLSKEYEEKEEKYISKFEEQSSEYSSLIDKLALAHDEKIQELQQSLSTASNKVEDLSVELAQLHANTQNLTNKYAKLDNIRETHITLFDNDENLATQLSSVTDRIKDLDSLQKQVNDLTANVYASTSTLSSMTEEVVEAVTGPAPFDEPAVEEPIFVDTLPHDYREVDSEIEVIVAPTLVPDIDFTAPYAPLPVDPNLVALPVKHPIEPQLLNASLPASNFGMSFPPKPNKGDLFLRVDMMPSKLYKWVEPKWIEVSKDAYDVFSYDQEYIKFLISQISAGELDIDACSTSEQDKISEYLRNL